MAEQVVIVLDVSPRLYKTRTGIEDETAISSALGAARLFVQQKVLFRPNDSVAVVLCGSTRTNNACVGQGDCYENVSVLRGMKQADRKLVKMLGSTDGLLLMARWGTEQDPSDSDSETEEESIDPSDGNSNRKDKSNKEDDKSNKEDDKSDKEDVCDPGTGLPHSEGDVLSALIVAVDLLHRNAPTGKKKVTRRIILVTDDKAKFGNNNNNNNNNDNNNNDNDDDDDGNEDEEEKMAMKHTCDAIVREGISLAVLGVNFTDDDDDDDDDEDMDVDNNDSNVNKTLDISSRRRMMGDAEIAFREFCDSCGGAVNACDSAMQVLSGFRAKSVLNQRATFNGALEVGTCKIRVRAFLKTKRATFPTLQKASAAPVEGGIRAARESNSAMERAGPVSTMTTYHVATAAGTRDIQKEDRVRAYRYGTNLIPFSEADEAMAKRPTERAFKLLGFTPAENVPRHYLMGAVAAFVSPENATNDAVALSALIHAMAEKKKYGIVRYVRAKNSPPQLGVIFPYISARLECLHYSQLPFADDIRSFYFRPMPQPKDAHRAAFRALIERLDLMELGSAEAEGLDPECTFNPALQHFYQCLEDRALADDDDAAARTAIRPLDERIRVYLEPEKELEVVAKKEFADLQSACSGILKPIADAGSKRKRDGWGDDSGTGNSQQQQNQQQSASSLSSSSSSLADSDAKKSSKKHAASMDELRRRKVRRVGEEDPISDFQAMMTNRTEDLVDDAMEQMRSLIFTTIDTSVRSMNYPKALDCILAMRESAVAEDGEAAGFNKFLIEARDKYKSARPPFYDILRERVRPINKKESRDADFTEAEAASFYEAAMENLGISAASQGGTADDLDDDDFD